MAKQVRQKSFNVSAGEVVTLPSDAGTNPRITSITRRKSESVNFATNLPQAGNWKIVNGAVQFIKGFARVQIFYEPQLTDEQGAAIFGKDNMDDIAAFRGQMAASVEGLQFDKMNLEGAVVKDFGESGGFKAVQNFAQPFKNLTDRPMLAKSTASACTCVQPSNHNNPTKTHVLITQKFSRLSDVIFLRLSMLITENLKPKSKF